ncbi:uncharacterized protein PRCAT00002781001 [Priceomyces carsonii]|uniref:uncharacterized protein n=1 Tax=Priceomyces carsonii TaxID=28549 RepID=UPI002ED89FFC|nr:unnamed protein product [Priceomyces carsonii]
MAKKTKSKEGSSPIPETLKKKNTKDTKLEAIDPDGKKPQRGLAIGENFGWTGKLPATLLYEHCQKQKWGKATFDMRKESKGFTAVVNLSWENPKTKELINIKMVPDRDLYSPKETSNEARHAAATYAMHRINYVKNMKMVLPNTFRDYWSDLESKRLNLLKQNKEEHDAIYNSNPFQVYLNKKEKREKREKELQIKEQNDKRVQRPQLNIASKIGGLKKEGKRNTVSIPNSAEIPSFPKKVWSNSPFVDFPSNVRLSIESSVREHIRWEVENSQKLSDQDRREYSNTFYKLGFREAHVKEAFKYTSSFNDALEWLLFHIPEDDLPSLFTKSADETGVTLKISKDIQREYLLKRLHESGFDMDEIVTTLEENHNDEIKTSIALTRKLCPRKLHANEVADNQEIWEQEIESINCIGSNSANFLSDSCKRIVLIGLNPKGLEKNLLSIKLFNCDRYPNDIPGMFLIVNDLSFKLASYIKLSILRNLIEFLFERNIIGDCFIYSIIEWLEDNIANVIKNPGPLLYIEEGRSDVTSEVSSSRKPEGRSKKRVEKSLELLIQEIEAAKKRYKARQESEQVQNSIRKRKLLPAWNKRHQLVSAINEHKITLVTGETGSGKSTQTVQFILDYLNSKDNFSSTIICTQPRRISTIGLAERISEERLENVGDEVGYVIRGENKTSKNTRITFATTGVLLRMLQSFLQSGENNLFKKLGYIFVDEVHERSVDSDFLLIILKKIMGKFPNLKIILMSATIDVDIFKSFFHTPVNHIHIEGRTYPIEDHYLGEILDDVDFTIKNSDHESVKPKPDSFFFKNGNINYDLIALLCLKVDFQLREKMDDGSILIFLPGIAEINQCISQIESKFKDTLNQSWCLPLHSALASVEQKKVFRSAKKGVRKIVVSTNVAETSITINDCVVVIDSGRSKTLFYDPSTTSTKLIENWCSKAETGQRRGRAGRVREGFCFHLYTQDTYQNMRSEAIPEIKRTRLENLYLVVKAMNINNVEEFLNDGLDPPDQKSLSLSKDFLSEIGALRNDKLSHLGKYLSYLPTDLQSGKLLILGCIFSCLDMCLTLASIQSVGSPFSNSFDLRDKIKEIQNQYSDGQGDLIGMANVYKEYERVKSENKNVNKFISSNCLSYMSLKDINSTKVQLLSILKDIGFVPMNYGKVYDTLNRNSENYSIIRSAITGAYYPQIARVQLPDPKYLKSFVGAIEVEQDARQTKYWIRNNGFMNQKPQEADTEKELPAIRAFIHPSSVLFSSTSNQNTVPDIEKYLREDGSFDSETAKEIYNTPPLVLSSGSLIKSSFIVYGSSHHSSKLFLRDVTPTSTLVTLLFGGEIVYDLTSNLTTGNKSPGIVLDKWLPIRTWCKNGVLIKRLRILLDNAINDRLSQPHYFSSIKELDKPSDSDRILSIVEKVVGIS